MVMQRQVLSHDSLNTDQPEGMMLRRGKHGCREKILVKLDPQAFSLADEMSFLHNTTKHNPVDELGVENRGLCSGIQPTVLNVVA